MATADYSSYHQQQGTVSDGSKFDNLIDAIQGTVNALDNTNIAAAAGIDLSKIADPGVGKVVGSGGTAAAAVYPPGFELDYKQITSDVTVAGITEGAATTVITGDATTFDGTRVRVEFVCPQVGIATGESAFLVFLRDSTVLGQAKLGANASGSTLQQPALHAIVFDTPSAASHTYTVKAFTTTTNQTTVKAGAGGSGALVPAFLRITKA